MPAIQCAPEFTMRGTTLSGDYVTWHVSLHPDFEAKKAPESVEPGSVTIRHTLSDGPPWLCLVCNTRIPDELDHEKDSGACDMEIVRKVMES